MTRFSVASETTTKLRPTGIRRAAWRVAHTPESPGRWTHAILDGTPLCGRAPTGLHRFPGLRFEDVGPNVCCDDCAELARSESRDFRESLGGSWR